MKKKFKVFVALIVIVALAFGAYFILNKGTNNKQIYAKVYSLNNELTVNEVNIYEKTNQTVIEMITIINNKGYELPEVLNDFRAFESFLSDYEEIKNIIIANAAFVNNKNTNPYFKKMQKAYKNITNIYEEGYDYLKNTHLAITDPELYNKTYIENFYNVFKDALEELNKFYINAGLSFVLATENSMQTNSKQKLELEYYCLMLDYFNQTYIEQSGDVSAEGGEEVVPPVDVYEFMAIKNILVQMFKDEVSQLTFDVYMENKQDYDDLAKTKKIDKALIIKNYFLGTVTDYINGITNEEEKSMAQKYLTLVVEG